ncbi:MAG TPA: imidazole glycerol phosphate synthase subunit HisH, partial [Woeseiaceae bacterium]|nr:imidazole glycerol phosphate synthase subunit HisH [Woeseiaceae bacterium]
MNPVVLIDNGGANLASVRNAFDRLGATITVTRDAAVIAGAERVVLPGVGAAGDGMRRLREAELDDVVVQ